MKKRLVRRSFALAVGTLGSALVLVGTAAGPSTAQVTNYRLCRYMADHEVRGTVFAQNPILRSVLVSVPATSARTASDVTVAVGSVPHTLPIPQPPRSELDANAINRIALPVGASIPFKVTVLVSRWNGDDTLAAVIPVVLGQHGGTRIALGLNAFDTASISLYTKQVGAPYFLCR